MPRVLLEMARVRTEAPARRKVADPSFTKAGQKWNWDFVLFMPIKDEDLLARDHLATESTLRAVQRKAEFAEKHTRVQGRKRGLQCHFNL